MDSVHGVGQTRPEPLESGHSWRFAGAISKHHRFLQFRKKIDWSLRGNSRCGASISWVSIWYGLFEGVMRTDTVANSYISWTFPHWIHFSSEENCKQWTQTSSTSVLLLHHTGSESSGVQLKTIRLRVGSNHKSTWHLLIHFAGQEGEAESIFCIGRSSPNTWLWMEIKRWPDNCSTPVRCCRLKGAKPGWPCRPPTLGSSWPISSPSSSVPNYNLTMFAS